MVDGAIVACASEERFSRIKRDESYPLRAIEYCLEAAGIKGDQVDVVSIGGVNWDFWRWLTRYYSSFSIEDLVREQSDYWHPKLFSRKNVSWPQLFRGKWDLKQYPGTWGKLAGKLGDEIPLSAKNRETANGFLDEVICAHLGCGKERIVRVDQHTALGAYAYWSSTLRGEGAGVVVLDASREATGASVATPLRFGLIRLCSIAAADFRVGRLIRDVTLMLGLPPRDHDPVVMGLASHASARGWRAAYRVFEAGMKVDGLEFKNSDSMKDTYFHFLDRLQGLPDEAVAGGAQRFAEDLIAEWISAVVHCNRLPRLAISGSLSMNHRIMGKLAELDGVEELFVPPAAGDGALALGAILHLSLIRFGVVPGPMTHCYLGPDITDRDVKHATAQLRSSGAGYEFTANPSPERIAGLLAGGSVIGRCVGRMEFGSRGLGNRSILADPRNGGVVPFIAAKIKARAAHVPFSPTILSDRSDRYLKNPKRLPSPFMTMAFQVKPKAFTDLAAAIDADDGTVRPQLLDHAANPEFAQIIRAFDRATGVGAVLNTSFNDHAAPMVATAKDAVGVFTNSSLDYLLLGSVLIGKRGATLRRRGAVGQVRTSGL
jgi:carbamoyltransferase